MWKYIFLGLLLGVGGFAAIYWYFYMSDSDFLRPARDGIEKIAEKPLDKYTFENLRKVEFAGGEIKIGEKVEEESDAYDSYIYYFEIKNLDDENKPFAGSGLMNIPVEEEGADAQQAEYPVIVQFRGFVPKEDYAPGVGSMRSGEYFAENGFITLAPDFLGFGESDMPSENSLEDRFQTYTTALSQLASVDNLNEGLSVYESEEDGKTEEITARWDGVNIGIWGHSNGGHIALSALALGGEAYPTVLWNPVSKDFPYSIFYYMDEYDDKGRDLRKVIADFESEYDIRKYSPPNFYKWINAPIQIHQGLGDREVLPWWSEELSEKLEDDGVEVEYLTYPNSDHNLMPEGWGSAVENSVDFYRREFDESEL